MQTEQVKVGSVICNKGSGNAYVVTDICNGRITAVRTMTVGNPDEWELVSKENDLLEVVKLAADIGVHERAIDYLHNQAKAAIARINK